MPNRFTPKPEDIDEAVSKSLEHNSRSTIMYLLRERLIREVVETTWPLAQAALIERILELEAEINDLREGGVTAEPESPRAKRLREELLKMKDTIKEQQDNA